MMTGIKERFVWISRLCRPVGKFIDRRTGSAESRMMAGLEKWTVWTSRRADWGCLWHGRTVGKWVLWERIVERSIWKPRTCTGHMVDLVDRRDPCVEGRV